MILIMYIYEAFHMIYFNENKKYRLLLRVKRLFK